MCYLVLSMMAADQDSVLLLNNMAYVSISKLKLFVSREPTFSLC